MENEGLKNDAGKLRYSLVPVVSLKETVSVLTFGAEKYDDENWKKVENPVPRYTDALMRHLEKWRGGETYDRESGFHHLAHVVCCAMFIIYFELKDL